MNSLRFGVLVTAVAEAGTSASGAESWEGVVCLPLVGPRQVALVQQQAAHDAQVRLLSSQQRMT